MFLKVWGLEWWKSEKMETRETRWKLELSAFLTHGAFTIFTSWHEAVCIHHNTLLISPKSWFIKKYEEESWKPKEKTLVSDARNAIFSHICANLT